MVQWSRIRCFHQRGSGSIPDTDDSYFSNVIGFLFFSFEKKIFFTHLIFVSFENFTHFLSGRNDSTISCRASARR